jgi:hypothetical protein
MPDLTEYTTTEAETLATILDNAIRHMTTAHTPTGGYAWVESLHDAVEDIVFGFYDITHGAIKAGATIDLYAVAL